MVLFLDLLATQSKLGEFFDAATPDDEEFYLQEMLLGRYVKKLLTLKELRTLLQFGKIVNRDLRTWLLRERYTRESSLLFSPSALLFYTSPRLSSSSHLCILLLALRRRSAAVEEWSESLHLIHEQFQWPYPPPPTDFKTLITNINSSSSTTATTISESSAQQQTRQELK